MPARYNRHVRVSCPLVALVVAAALAALAAPPSASAQDAAGCRPGAPAGESIAARFEQLDPAGAVRAVLGAQDAETQLDPPAASWSAGVAPGPLSVDGARVAIEQALRDAYGPADATFLIGTMRVVAQPYPMTELRRIQQSLLRELHQAGLTGWSISRTCRVVITLGAPNGPAEKAKADQVAAPYGDAVRVVLTAAPGPKPIDASGVAPDATAATPGAGGTTTVSPAPGAAGVPAAQPAKVSLWKVLSLPRTSRCVVGSAVTLRPGAAVLRLRVTVRARTTVAVSGKAVRVALRGRSTKVRVSVAVAGGRTATRDVTYRRCAARVRATTGRP